MKEKMITRIIFSILILGILTTIFIFSNQNGSESKSVSEKFMQSVIDIYPKTSKLSNKEKQNLVLKSQPFIRKTAHFTIYMVAGFLIMGFLSTYNLKISKRLIITISLGVIYAIFDELHQGIVGGGRTPRIFDVFIDTLGVLTGSAISLFITNLKNYIFPNIVR